MMQIILVAVTIIVTGLINKKTNDISVLGFDVRQLFSWIVAVLTTFIGNSIIVPADTSVYLILLQGFINGLIANGVYKIKLVAYVLELLHLKPIDNDK